MELTKDIIRMIAWITGSVVGLLSIVTFFITKYLTIKKMEERFITVENCKECKKESEGQEEIIEELLKNHTDEFKIIRLGLSELFEKSGIPREKMEQIREDVRVNGKFQDL